MKIKRNAKLDLDEDLLGGGAQIGAEQSRFLRIARRFDLLGVTDEELQVHQLVQINLEANK